MDADATQAYSALQTALASGRGSIASQLIAEPSEMPPNLVRMARASGNAAFYDDSHPIRPRMWAAQALPDGRVVATSVDATPDLLSRMALDRHMWKYPWPLWRSLCRCRPWPLNCPTGGCAG